MLFCCNLFICNFYWLTHILSIINFVRPNTTYWWTSTKWHHFCKSFYDYFWYLILFVISILTSQVLNSGWVKVYLFLLPYIEIAANCHIQIGIKLLIFYFPIVAFIWSHKFCSFNNNYSGLVRELSHYYHLTCTYAVSAYHNYDLWI